MVGLLPQIVTILQPLEMRSQTQKKSLIFSRLWTPFQSFPLDLCCFPLEWKSPMLLLLLWVQQIAQMVLWPLFSCSSLPPVWTASDARLRTILRLLTWPRKRQALCPKAVSRWYYNTWPSQYTPSSACPLAHGHLTHGICITMMGSWLVDDPVFIHTQTYSPSLNTKGCHIRHSLHLTTEG